jgi:ssDNA-binding replication factor A large subunit
MMEVKIADIKPHMHGIEIVAKIISIGPMQTVYTRFGKAEVAQAILSDGKDTIILNLWRDQIKMVKIGDTVRIENAFVKEFRGQLELNIGSDGKIIVLK